MLTIGITNVLGDMNKDPYVQTLKQSPAASQVISGDINDANTLLNLNMPDIKQRIKDGSEKAINATPLPAPAKDAAQKQFSDKQNDYSDKVINAFATSIHHIFIVTSSIAAIAFVASFWLKERQLRAAKPSETPSEV